MRNSYTVNIEIRGIFVQRVNTYKKGLLAFVEGRGELPTEYIDSIKNSMIDRSVDSMVKSGCNRAMAKRISEATLNDLMYSIMDDGMNQSL